MGRRAKIGLDYFPVDVTIDDNLELVEAELGLAGFAIVVKLWQKIYANGYYLDWSDDVALLFARKINTDVNTVNSVINACFHRNILDGGMFERHRILTSRGIQKRYFDICKQLKRGFVETINDYLLANREETPINPEETPINPSESAQRKGKEKKGNKRGENTGEKIIPEWRNDIQVYQKNIWIEFDKITRDKKWIEEQEKLNPNLDILLTIEKSIKVFWGTEDGWKNKKKSKAEEPNWKSTFARTMDMNKVYKQKSMGFKQSPTNEPKFEKI